MGWKGTVRSINASHRQYEREAQRRQRELERQRQQLEKMEELERAAYEVQVYENYSDLLLSVHKECNDLWDWEIIRTTEPPIKPEKSQNNEELAQAKRNKFKPGVFDKMLKRVESKLDKLAMIVEEARQADENKYRESVHSFEQKYADWEATLELAERMLSGNTEAYIDAIRQTDPLNDISKLGSSLDFKAESISIVNATLHVNSEEVIPSEVKSLLKSGKLSVKQMPKGKFYELYQDHICSCVLRIARELFALLPIEMVLVNCLGNLLSSQTGYMEEKSILSVAIPRKTLEGLNFEMLDPSDSMSNFIHRMAFKRTTGFGAVESLKVSDLQTK